MVDYQSLDFMGEVWAAEEYLMSSVHAEYKATSLGAILEVERRQKAILSPTDVGEMRRKASKKGGTKGT